MWRAIVRPRRFVLRCTDGCVDATPTERRRYDSLNVPSWVMELHEGMTLKNAIAGRPMGLERLLPHRFHMVDTLSTLNLDLHRASRLELLGDAGGAVSLDEFEFDPNAIGVAAGAASATVCGGWFGSGHGEIGEIG
jgi:hypothetical protein